MSLKQELIADGLKSAVERLAKGGAAIRFDFPEEVVAAQSIWPDDCPLTEDELREELKSALADLKRLGDRLKELDDRLPPAAADRGDCPGGFENIPSGVYELLSWAVNHIYEDAIPEIENQVMDALTATPERLRAEWVKHQVPRRVAEVLRQVVPEAERYGWTKDDDWPGAPSTDSSQ